VILLSIESQSRPYCAADLHFLIYHIEGRARQSRAIPWSGRRSRRFWRTLFSVQFARFGAPAPRKPPQRPAAWFPLCAITHRPELDNMRQGKLEHQNLNDRTYAILKGGLISGTFHPGQVFIIRSLAERYGISTTPVREALQRLVPYACSES
jgi:hypothetical protein